MSKEVQYPDCDASYTVTEGLVARKKRPHRKLDGPFFPRDVIPLPEQSYIECDGKHLILLGGIDKKSDYIANTGVLIFFAALVTFVVFGVPIYSFGFDIIKDIEWFWWPITAFLWGTGIYYFLKYSRTIFESFIIFNREAGTVMFPPHEGLKQFVVPFEQVECYGTMHYHSRGGKHYFTHLIAKKKPRGEKDRECPIHFSEAYGRTPVEKEWKLICTFMDKEQPIPKVFDRWINEFKRTGINVCRKIVDQAAYDKALAEEEAEETKAAREAPHASDYS